MDIHRYLKRINFQGEIAPNLNCLSALQKGHLLNIPFENLDIHFGNELVLKQERNYDKIVLHNRGGFCYELNGLFYYLLQSIGFEVQLISARVFDKEKGYGKEFDHMALIVSLEDNEYLVDVGFGEFVFKPLLIKTDQVQKDERGDFFLDQYEQDYFRVNKRLKKETIPQYIFKKTHRKHADFEAMCSYHQTSPDSHFTHKKFIGIPTIAGRRTIIGSNFKTIHQGSINERQIEETEWKDLLIKHFKYTKDSLQ